MNIGEPGRSGRLAARGLRTAEGRRRWIPQELSECRDTTTETEVKRAQRHSQGALFGASQGKEPAVCGLVRMMQNAELPNQDDCLVTFASILLCIILWKNWNNSFCVHKDVTNQELACLTLVTGFTWIAQESGIDNSAEGVRVAHVDG